jgi:hypothetical protein
MKRRGLTLLVLFATLSLLGSGCATTESGYGSSLPGPESYVAYQSGYSYMPGYGYAPFEPFWWGDPFSWGDPFVMYPPYPYCYGGGSGCGGKPCGVGHKKGHHHPARPAVALGEGLNRTPRLAARDIEPPPHELLAPHAPALAEMRSVAPGGVHAFEGFHGPKGFHGGFAPAAHGFR